MFQNYFNLSRALIKNTIILVRYNYNWVIGQNDTPTAFQSSWHLLKWFCLTMGSINAIGYQAQVGIWIFVES
jgi:hypothetical protein